MLLVATYFRKHQTTNTLLRTFEILQFTFICTLKILINQVEFDYRFENTGNGAAWNYLSNLSVRLLIYDNSIGAAYWKFYKIGRYR